MCTCYVNECRGFDETRVTWTLTQRKRSLLQLLYTCSLNPEPLVGRHCIWFNSASWQPSTWHKSGALYMLKGADTIQRLQITAFVEMWVQQQQLLQQQTFRILRDGTNPVWVQIKTKPETKRCVTWGIRTCGLEMARFAILGFSST